MTKYWIWLSMVPYIGPVTANRLLNIFGDPEKVYQADTDALRKVKGITKRQVASIQESKSLEPVYRILQNCEKHDISVLTQMDPRYPNRAKEPEDSPILLYYKGCIRDMKHTVGIVGARRCSQEARQAAINITEKYVSDKTVIVSGMAKGIDSYAHTACLRAGGYTVAVLGNGLDICYPSEHLKLMERIAAEGLLISEYPPGTKPAGYRFPRRNRIISAWSDKLIVIAPGKGSGTNHTAGYERSYGRDVEVLKADSMI